MAEQVRDSRNRRGLRHSLETLLLICVGGILRGEDTPEAIARFANSRSARRLTRRARRGKSMPARTTIRNFLSNFDSFSCLKSSIEALSAQLPKSYHVIYAVDGKALRGAHLEGTRAPLILNIATHGLGIVVSQVPVDEKRNEFSMFEKLLDPLDLKGAILTADAIQTNVSNAEYIVSQKHAHYVLPVKANQPTLFEMIDDENLTGRAKSAESVDKGHGRLETRTIWTMEAPEYVKAAFPHAQQICAVHRSSEKLSTGTHREEMAYYITSLCSKDFEPDALLRIIRGHWHIESKVHYSLDVTFREDQCRSHVNEIPFAMSALRKTCMNIMRAIGFLNLSAGRQAIRENL